MRMNILSIQLYIIKEMAKYDKKLISENNKKNNK